MRHIIILNINYIIEGYSSGSGSYIAGPMAGKEHYKTSESLV